MAEPGFFQSVQLTELTLRVADLAQVQAFYQDVLGFAPLEAAPGTVTLAPPGAPVALLVLHGRARRASASARRGRPVSRRVPVPDRTALARVLQKLLELGVPIGSADHGVSEAHLPVRSRRQRHRALCRSTAGGMAAAGGPTAR